MRSFSTSLTCPTFFVYELLLKCPCHFFLHDNVRLLFIARPCVCLSCWFRGSRRSCLYDIINTKCHTVLEKSTYMYIPGNSLCVVSFYTLYQESEFYIAFSKCIVKKKLEIWPESYRHFHCKFETNAQYMYMHDSNIFSLDCDTSVHIHNYNHTCTRTGKKHKIRL